MPNDFFRSNLGIQPKQRLMSAGSFINPVQTYDANEQMRIVESFRGLSAEGDKLIDGFIKKKQDEAQQKADQYMTDAMLDPNHPDHKKAKEMLNGLKPQAVNLLGVDYWTQQYISKAQAEQLFKKEEYEMADAKQKYANLSPDEFREKLGQIRVKTDDELTTYPKSVRDYFYRMPRQELTDKIRDKHYEAIMQEQLKTRDNIAVNKANYALDGLFDVVYNMPDLEDETLDFINYEDYANSLKDKATKEEIDKVSLLYDWEGQKDEAGYFMPIDHKADILQYRKLSQSPVVENVLSAMREYAAAGAKPSEVKERIYEAFTKFVTDNEDLGDEADILFNIIMDKANNDTILQKEAGSWNYTNKTGKDHDIALFDMSDVSIKGKQLRQLATQAGRLKQAEYEANETKNRQNIIKFLNDAELSGKIKREDILNKTADQIADMLGLNKVSQGEHIETWRQIRLKSTTMPLNEYHYFQYDKWKHNIHNGRVTSEKQIWQGLLNNEFHPRHYDDLVNELERGGTLSAKEQQLHNYITKYAKEYIKETFINEPQKMLNLMQQVDNLAWDGIKDGTFVSVYEANDYGSKILQIIGAIPSNKGLTINKGATLDELQTRGQFRAAAEKELVTPVADNKTGIIAPQLYFYKEETYEDFLNGTGKKYKELGTPEPALREMYNELQTQSRQRDKQVREKQLIDIAKKDTVTKDELITILHENPDALTKAFNGIELTYINGVIAPKDKELRSRFMSLITNKVVNRSKTAKREVELLKSFTNINGSD